MAEGMQALQRLLRYIRGLTGMENFVCYTLIFLMIGHSLAAEELEFKNATDTLKEVLQNYDKLMIPKMKGKPVEVTVQLYLTDMVPLNSLHLHFSMDFFLRQEWYDIRLAYDKGDNESVLILPGEMQRNIWMPDLYFPNAKEAKQYTVTTLNGGIHVYGDGRVFSSERLSLTAFCPMDLTYFPFDVQTCYFSIGSYAYQSGVLDLKWRWPNPVLKSKPNAPLHMREFEHVDYFVSNVTENFRDVGKTKGRFSMLKLKFIFRRDIRTHLIRDYIPCILTVSLSWISFWIDFRSSPARVALGVTTVLTMVTLSTSLKWKLPSGSDFRSIDLYLLVCNTYVFAVAIEFAFVSTKEAQNSCLRRLGGIKEVKKQGSKDDIEDVEMESLVEYHEDEVADSAEPNVEASEVLNRVTPNDEINELGHAEARDHPKHEVRSTRSVLSLKHAGKDKPNSHHIDRLCRILFPTSFVFLNILYFVFHFIHFDIDNNHSD